VVGKNFSANNLGQRKASDFYETPYSMTQQFLDTGELSPRVATLEPAHGKGAIVRVLKKNGFADVTAYDQETDFLKERRTFGQGITNPPFSLAKEFILKSKQVFRSKFALLLPLSYLHGKERLDTIYSDKAFPLKCCYVFCRYPMLGDDLRADGKYRTGMMVYAWFVWDRRYKGEPMIRWLDNQPHILSARTL